MRRVTVLANFSTGAISGDTTICYNAVPYLNVTTSPSGAAGTYNYQWYYQDGLASAAPTGTSTSGWTSIPGATSRSYTPSSGITANRTYSLTIDPTGTPDCISPTWVGSMRRVTVLPNYSTGAISGDTTICYNAVPYLNVTTSPSGATGTYNYQWYYQDGLASTAPTGTSTSGWTVIAGATSSSYTPSSGITANRTYSLTIDPTGTPDCISPTWVGSMRRVTVLPNFSTGAISGDTTICYNAVPYLNVTTSPSGANGTFNYQWYYQDGLASTAPTGTSTTGWTLVAGATSSSYTPSTGITANRTYSLTIDPTGTPDCISPTWVGSMRRVTVLANFSTGAISGDTTICYNAVPYLNVTTSPSGAAGTYNYQWYYQDGIVSVAPTGTSTTGWTLIPGATSTSYTPSTGLTASRTYSLTIDPTGTPDCISPTWVGSSRRVTVLSNFTTGSITSADEHICISGDPSNITMSSAPSGASGTYNYQWYYKDGLITAPTGTSTTGWTSISSATSSSYDPPSGLSVNRTYAVTVDPTGTPDCIAPTWTGTARQVTIDSTSVGGTLTGGTSPICIGADPGAMTLTGYRGAVNNWNVSYNGAGFSTIASTATSYDPGALTPNGRYAYKVTVQNGVCPSTTSTIDTIIVNPTPVGGTAASTSTVICSGDSTTAVVSGYTGVIQWQVSTVSPFTVYNDISGATSSSYNTGALTATGSSIVQRKYRAKLTNPGCGSTDYSLPVTISIYPPSNGGTVTPSQLVCYNYNPADISVSGYVGTINRWEWSTNSSFTSPTTVSSTLATLSGTSIGSLTANRYYRAIVQNGVCTETPSSSPAYIRVNNPDNLGNSSSVGSCTVDGTGGWINIFDSSNKLIASVNGNGNNLGTVTVNSYVRSAPGFINDSHVHDAVHDINCAGTPQAYMNRSYKFSTSNPLSSGTALVRLYFTDAELAALIDSSISSAATYPAVSTIASDPSGCADDDDVQNINQLYITQYSGVSEDNDYSNNSSNPSDYTVHKPVALGGTLANSGTGNANYGANYVEATLTRFSEFWLDGSQHGVPLPVKLVKLDATNMNNSYIRVSWTTEIEVNNAGFDVLRSTDGKTFTKVGSIKGNGNTTQISNYFFDDHEVVANTVYYYQLKQIDMDGKSELSYIVSSEIKPIDRSAVIGDFVPNPADNLTHIEITAYKAEKISVSVYNMIGEWMFSYDKEVAPGANKLTFSTDNLSSGTYFVKFSSDNQNLSKKLVVTR